LSEQKINKEQLSQQHDELVAQTQGLEQVVDKACQNVLELVVPADLPIAEQIHKLASGFHGAKEEATRVQLELNLQIVELRLKAQSSMPPKS